MDAPTLAKHLEKHLRVATFPVGIRPLAPGEPMPAKARRPSKDLGAQVAICQCVALARRYGWTIAFSGEDLACPIAKAAFGFEDRIPYYERGSLAEGMYASCQEAGAAFESALPRFAPNEVSGVALGPLDRLTFEPETVVVYGNSAQVLRLVNAALYEKGGSFKTEFTGRGDCADIVIRTRQTKEPQLILPCYGDRVFGLAADDEMAFTFPFGMAEAIVAGLEGTSRGGIRYPIPTFALRAHPAFPPSYVELERRWRAGEQ
ncbi:DUF169 domain-containing protein [Anaeromyxobacter terrae]|uniref:DUF169 domain-containing protein n=1 Tax=Anaeromyxobacter terrae TaxID=2925406 RepID=UPI001F58C57B|nr:DUF169 domain-containing protein [Anaeromyxobacter sp. SG22]